LDAEFFYFLFFIQGKEDGCNIENVVRCT